MKFLKQWSLETGTKRVADLFQQQFSSLPESVWSAPGRVNLIGEHTDYNNGLCLPIALEHRTFAAYRQREDDVVRLVSAQCPTDPWIGKISDINTGNIPDWVAYAAGPAWALQITHGFDAAFDSCVPFGAGLSSSAAIECAIGSALLEPTTFAQRQYLAKACIKAENEVAGAPTGGMDQSASLLCEKDHALLLDCDTWQIKQIPLNFASANLALLMIDTRAKHALNDGQYAKRRATCEQAAAELNLRSLREASLSDLSRLSGEKLRRVRHIVTEVQRVKDVVTALQNDDFQKVGELFVQSHSSMRDDYEISCPELDLAVETALSAGALGARMTGGGFGGSAIAIVHEADIDTTAEQIADEYARAGFNEPQFLSTTPAQGAERSN